MIKYFEHVYFRFSVNKGIRALFDSILSIIKKIGKIQRSKFVFAGPTASVVSPEAVTRIL